jgi:hypothetical protein
MRFGCTLCLKVPPMIAIFFRVLLGLAGLLLLYVGFFLTETEEGQLQTPRGTMDPG